MSNTSKELFKKALAEAMAQKYTEELRECGESAVCTAGHYDKMQKIIGRCKKTPKRKFPRKALIAIIIAAAMLLTGCAAYICRNDIRDFVEEIYEKFIRITYCEDHKLSTASIDEIYELTYVPDGYELVYEKCTSVNIFYKFENEDGERLFFEHDVLDNSAFGLDYEKSNGGLHMLGETEIYKRVFETSSYYMWNDGKYAFCLTSTVELDPLELEKIVLGAEKDK